MLIIKKNVCLYITGSWWRSNKIIDIVNLKSYKHFKECKEKGWLLMTYIHAVSNSSLFFSLLINGSLSLSRMGWKCS